MTATFSCFSNENQVLLTYRPQPPSGSWTERRYLTISFFQASARGILATWQVIRRPEGQKWTPIITTRPTYSLFNWLNKESVDLKHVTLSNLRTWRRNRFVTWEQEERSTVVPCPVAILSLEVAVEIHTLQSCIYSRVGSGRAWHELTLWKQ